MQNKASQVLLRLALAWLLVLAIALPATRRAAPAQAQTGGELYGAAAAACGPAALACIAGAIAGQEALCQYTAMPCLHDVLIDSITNFGNWWNGSGAGSAAKQQFVNQYGQHSNYFTITQEMLNAWWDAAGTFSSAGFVYDATGNGSGVAVYHRTIGTVGSIQTVTLTSTPFTIGGGGTCNMVSRMYNVISGPTGLKTSGADALRYELIDATSAALLATLAVPSMYSSTGPLVWSSAGSAIGSAECSWVGQSLKIRVVMQVGAGGLKDVWATSLQWVGLKVNYTSGSPTLHWLSALDFPQVVTTAGAQPALGDRTTVLANPDDLIGWNGTDALPLATGVTALPVQAIPAATPTQDVAWWEGLFGGVTGGLGNILGALQGIGSNVTDIGTAIAGVPAFITSFPAVLTAAMTDAFVPQQSISARVGAIAVPTGSILAWPSDIFAGFGLLFSGGDACPDMTLPGYGPFNDVPLNMCMPPGAKTIFYVISRIVAAVALAFWGWGFVRRVMGEPS